MQELDIGRLFEESEVIEPEELEAERRETARENAKPPTAKSLDEQYRQAMEAQRSDFASRVRQRLQQEYEAALESLIAIMKSDKNLQCKTAATRTFFKLADDYGVHIADPMKDLMNDVADSIDRSNRRED